jgi:hypothetical protein
MRPHWREIEAAREAEPSQPRDEHADREMLADMRSRVESAEPVTEAEASLSGEGQLRDHPPASARAEGKWRMVSKEVEEAEGEGDA